MHASNVYHTPWPGKLAEKLVRLTKQNGGLGFAAGSGRNGGEGVDIQVFFSNSGTEANEGALKIAKKVGKERWAMKHKGRGWDATQDGECSKSGIVCFEVGMKFTFLAISLLTSADRMDSMVEAWDRLVLRGTRNIRVPSNR